MSQQKKEKTKISQSWSNARTRSNLSNWETKLTENDAILHFSCELVRFLKMEEIFLLHCQILDLKYTRVSC